MTERSIALKHPVEIRTTAGELVEKISNITLRPLQGGDFLSAMDAACGADGSIKVGSLLRHLAVKSSRLSADRINKLNPEDLFSVIEVVQGFLPSGQQIGLPALNSSAEPSDTQPTSESGDPAA